MREKEGGHGEGRGKLRGRDRSCWQRSAIAVLCSRLPVSVAAGTELRPPMGLQPCATALYHLCYHYWAPIKQLPKDCWRLNRTSGIGTCWEGISHLLRIKEKVRIKTKLCTEFASSALAPMPHRHPQLSSNQIIPAGCQSYKIPVSHRYLAHPWKTKLSFFERNVRNHSFCLHSCSSSRSRT